MRISDWSSDVCSSDLPLTHHENPKRGMGQLGRDVDIEAPVVERVQIFRESFPVPWEALDHDHLGYILHSFHDGDEHVALVGLARGEANAAIPQDRKHTRLTSSHYCAYGMPSSA